MKTWGDPEESRKGERDLLLCRGYLAAPVVLVNRIAGGQHEPVLCRGLLRARSAVVAIVNAAAFAPHTIETDHLQSKDTNLFKSLLLM